MSHRYSDSNGNRIPSVTEIVNLMSDGERWWTESARLAGVEAHSRAESALLTGYGHPAVLDFVRDTGFLVSATETEVRGDIGGMKYAGRFDCVGTLGGAVVLVDFKNGQPDKQSVASQLSAYRHAYSQERGLNPHDIGAGVLVLKTGKWRRVLEHDLQWGWVQFCEKLHLYYHPAQILEKILAGLK